MDKPAPSFYFPILIFATSPATMVRFPPLLTALTLLSSFSVVVAENNLNQHEATIIKPRSISYAVMLYAHQAMAFQAYFWHFSVSL